MVKRKGWVDFVLILACILAHEDELVLNSFKTSCPRKKPFFFYKSTFVGEKTIFCLHQERKQRFFFFFSPFCRPRFFFSFERFKEQQERKHHNIIANLSKQLEDAKNYREQQDDMREIENLSELSSDERAQTVHKLLTEKQEIRRKYTEMQAQNEKYAQQMKAFVQREAYNDKLRRNWQTQLRQMEQALLLSNQINNQNRAKYQQTITEKDTEIAKLRAYVTHQLHRQRTMRRGTRIAKPISSR